ncbi:MAG: EscU/YscU/HrcU family type III secretion system export apparatus switch protein [Thiohalomonadaceae bacterium]
MNDRDKKPDTAVALHYDGRNAPRLTAKGHGEVADAILAKAREHGIPLQENPELCRLLARLDLGESIPRELYVAVAEVLAFAYWVTGRTP